MDIVDHQEFTVDDRSFCVIVFSNGEWMVYENRFEDAE